MKYMSHPFKTLSPINISLVLFVSCLSGFLFKSIYLDHIYSFDGNVECIAYDPRYRYSRIDDDQLAKGSPIKEEWIRRDLRILSTYTKCVRTYYTTHGMERLPEIAQEMGIEVILGTLVSHHRQVVRSEIDTAIHLAKTYDNIRYILVGNEINLWKRWKFKNLVSERELIRYIKEVADAVEQPVSTSDSISSWLRLPQLIEAVDFIGINRQFYWSGTNVRRTRRELNSAYWQLRHKSNFKPVVFTEIGWPTRGAVIKSAVPGGKEFETFIDSAVDWAKSYKVPYVLFEAFDQPWKMHSNEGLTGGHWGLFYANGRPKFGIQHHTSYWYAAIIIIAALISLLFLVTMPRVSYTGTLITVLTVNIAVGIAACTVMTAYYEYMLWSALFLLLILPAEIGLFLLAAIFLRETVLRIGKPDFTSTRPIKKRSPDTNMPFVSLHVPCSNEDPDIVLECIQSLLNLTYPNYEVLLIDNNTTDPNMWKPLEDFASQASDSLTFFHLEKHEGFKAGALNYALDQTSQKADIIGVVDADYTVSPNWLTDLVGMFQDPNIAAVQCPQANRNWQDSLFKTSMRDEYEGFFHGGMVVRDEDNAIIQHGAMLLLRRKACQEVGNWDELCITEDTELGLRFLKAGWRVVYVCKEYGAGLVPLNYAAYCAQRSRWVQGAIQILKKHQKLFFGKNSKLSSAQKYHFIAGWLPWIFDIFSPLFCLLGIVLLARTWIDHLYFPPIEFSYPMIFYVIFRHITVFIIYKKYVKVGLWRTLFSSIAGLSLTNTIAWAVPRALFSKRLTFVRTDKSTSQTPSTLAHVRWDILPSLLLTFGSPFLIYKYGVNSPEAVCWATALCMLGFTGTSVGIMQYLSSKEPRT